MKSFHMRGNIKITVATKLTKYSYCYKIEFLYTIQLILVIHLLNDINVNLKFVRLLFDPILALIWSFFSSVLCQI